MIQGKQNKLYTFFFFKTKRDEQNEKVNKKWNFKLFYKSKIHFLNTKETKKIFFKTIVFHLNQSYGSCTKS